MVVFLYEIPVIVIILLLLAAVGGIASVLQNLAGIGMYCCAALYFILALLIAIAVYIVHSVTSEGLFPKVRGQHWRFFPLSLPPAHSIYLF